MGVGASGVFGAVVQCRAVEELDGDTGNWSRNLVIVVNQPLGFLANWLLATFRFLARETLTARLAIGNHGVTAPRLAVA